MAPTLALGVLLVGVRGLRSTPVTIVTLCAVAFGCGAFLSDLQIRTTPIEQIARAVPRCAVHGTVVESAGAIGALVAVQKLGCRDASLAGDLGIAIVGELHADAGSRATGEAWILPLGSDRSDGTARRSGAGARMRFRALEVAAPTDFLHRIPANIRSALRHATRDSSPGPAGLLRGLAIGDTSDIDPVTQDEFRDSGLSHLVAVSGSNVAIVVGAAALAFRRARLWVRAGSALGLLVLFVLVVGPEPSVLRAAAMGSLALIALVTGRTTEPILALGVATAAVITLRPEMVHSAGLHLSVAATAGIVLFGSAICARLGAVPRSIALVLGATLAAQVAVAPVLIATFGELSLVAPAANLLAAPAVPPATILSLGAALLYLVWPPLGRAAMELAEPFAAWILWVADRSAAVPFAAVELPSVVGIVVAGPVGWLALRVARRRIR